MDLCDLFTDIYKHDSRLKQKLHLGPSCNILQLETILFNPLLSQRRKLRPQRLRCSKSYPSVRIRAQLVPLKSIYLSTTVCYQLILKILSLCFQTLSFQNNTCEIFKIKIPKTLIQALNDIIRHLLCNGNAGYMRMHEKPYKPLRISVSWKLNIKHCNL